MEGQLVSHTLIWFVLCIITNYVSCSLKAYNFCSLPTDCISTAVADTAVLKIGKNEDFPYRCLDCSLAL